MNKQKNEQEKKKQRFIRKIITTSYSNKIFQKTDKSLEIYFIFFLKVKIK